MDKNKVFGRNRVSPITMKVTAQPNSTSSIMTGLKSLVFYSVIIFLALITLGSLLIYFESPEERSARLALKKELVKQIAFSDVTAGYKSNCKFFNMNVSSQSKRDNYNSINKVRLAKMYVVAPDATTKQMLQYAKAALPALAREKNVAQAEIWFYPHKVVPHSAEAQFRQYVAYTPDPTKLSFRHKVWMTGSSGRKYSMDNLTPNLGCGYIPAKILLLVKKSDDFNRYKTQFSEAAIKLLSNNKCIAEDLLENGGWIRSTSKGAGNYFAYCLKGANRYPTVQDRYYLNVFSGKISR